MRKLVIILIALAAATTFIRAIDSSGNMNMETPVEISEISDSETVFNE
ncbi:MAG: hypothetical protein LBI14_05855 [Treponema sp.]|nr:hypothetical protein [Treponema sp.]